MTRLIPLLQKMKRELVVLLRLVENRFCADCNTSLGETIICGSYTFGSWLCKSCADVHRTLGTGISKIKTVNEDWTDREAQIMVRAGNNAKVNSIYERYLPSGWTKCTPDSGRDDRELWIRAKYEMKMFALPGKMGRRDSISRVAEQKTGILPARIVDFFLVISPGYCRERLEDNASPEVIGIESLTFDPKILSCYPESESYKDMILPEHVGHFVYPTGVSLSSTEEKPKFFTFVLTDVSGVKIFGATLHVYELSEPEELAAMLGIPITSEQFLHWPIVFAPKALTILSHYPFFNLYREYLQQLYRISLSNSPIPIERYVSNFVNDVPLPPQGLVEVKFTLPDRVISITRPPKNQLPMVDFSYRPLFHCLSVEHILIVFSALCTERKVCFFSSNISLLTPVQEALLSLMFPLVWQGAFVPVMPSDMLDILDAPVPIIVGISSSIINNTTEMENHPGVMYVDLDRDKLYPGINDNGRPLALPPALPSKAEQKLKKVLLTFGHVSHKTTLFTQAGVSFPKGEHLVPIESFSAERGISLRAPMHGAGTNDHRSKGLTLTNRGNGISKTASQHPVICSRSSVPSTSLTDPTNNVGGEDGFDASEIRGAFLRLFVSILKHCHGYFTGEKPVASPSSHGGHGSREGSMDSFNFASARASTKQRILTMSSPSVFLSQMLDTQLFERFAEERSEAPDQPEIKFFNAAIAEKLNRSKISRLKLNTDFLTDKRDAVAETFTCPTPSNWGIDLKKTYTYLKFPELRKDLYGSNLKCRPLLSQVEVQRTRRVLSDEILQKCTYRQRGMTVDSRGPSSNKYGIDEMLSAAKKRFYLVNRSIMTFQSAVRGRFHRRWLRDAKKALLVLQRSWRAYRIRRLLEQYNAIERAKVRLLQNFLRGYLVRKTYLETLRKVKRLQTFVRMTVHRIRYRRALEALRLLQRVYRGYRVRKQYRRVLRGVVLFLAVVRGWMTRRRAGRARSNRLKELRDQLFKLWKAEATPLVHRGKFWWLLKTGSYTDIALHEDELKRLYLSLGLPNSHPSRASDRNSNSTFQTQFATVESLLRSNRTEWITRDPQNVARLVEERKALYKRLKGQMQANRRNEFFQSFNLTGKKKKQRLADTVWEQRTQADSSALVIMAAFEESQEKLREWLWERRKDRVTAAALYAVRACIRSIQKFGKPHSHSSRSKNSAKSSLLSRKGGGSGGSSGVRR